MNGFRLSWQVKIEQQGVLLREFLKGQHISKAALVDIKFNGGRIEVNQKEETVRYVLQAGDEVTVHFPLETPSEGLLAEDLPLNIIYEDDYVLVVNKEPFMNTIPSREHPTGSVANRLAGYYQKLKLASTVHVVTRLDRDTSGLMLIAKHRHIHHLLSEQQKQGDVNRTYQALVHGDFRGEGKIEAPIGRKSTSIIEREVREDGQYACTYYKVMSQQKDFSLVQLKLLTGRTHQIRVHMAYLGHPLLGDDLYGGTVDRINRQALHCSSLSFYHPFMHERVSFEAGLAQDMMDVIKG